MTRIMRVSFNFLGLFFIFMLVFSAPTAAFATPLQQAVTVPVTVTIYRLIEIDNPDSEFFAFHGDFYSRVRIDGFASQRSSEVSYDPGFAEGVIFTLPLVFDPFWTFTRDVDVSLGMIPIEIEIWDGDSLSSDDEIDVNPITGVRHLSLSYNLATGNWSGDVPANQTFSQGEGDSDRAKIFFDITTLSNNGDADGDGLLDGWETRGLDVDGDGTIDVDLPSFGANPVHKDLFLEFDWVTGQQPTQAAIQRLKAAFTAAPLKAGGVNNPDGTPGINLWVDTGNLADASAREDGNLAGTCGDGIDNAGDGTTDGSDPDCLVGDNLGGGNAVPDNIINNLDANFYATKRANFDAANRAWIFRYAVSGNPANASSGGQGEIGGNDFVEYNHDAGTIMHEFGHNLNLHHGGNVDNNCKPNYVSVMNYDLQFGIPQAGGGSIIDYSPPRFTGGRGAAPLPTLQENNLDEATILDATDASNRFVFVNGNGQKVQRQLNQSVDWNGDGDTIDSGLTENIDTSGMNGRPTACTNTSSSSTLTGSEDWTNIAMSFRQFGDSDDSAINPVTDPEPTLQELLELQQELNTTDVAIAISDSTDPAIAGTTLTYTVTVTNFGPNPASQVEVIDILPEGVSQVSNSAGCMEAPAGILTCDLGELLANTSAVITIEVLIDPSLVHNSGGPTTITNSATVTNLAGPDPTPDNNSVAESTQVIAVAEINVTKSAMIDPVVAGTDETYQLTITNNGPSDAENVSLTDATPTNTSFVSRTQEGGSAFTCTDPPIGGTGTISCNLPVLPAGESATFTIVVHVLSSAPDGSAITNTANAISTTDDPDLTNNSGEVTVSVIARADLVVTKSQEKDLVIADISQTYHLSLVNNGPSDAQNVTFSDPTPANTTFVSFSQDSGPAFTCTTPPVGGAGNVICTISTLTTGSSASFTMVVSISPVDTEAITNTASSNSSTVDPDPSNNTATVAAKDSIKAWKKAVLTDLITLRSTVTDKQVSQKMDQAIKNLSDSLNPSWWMTENALDSKQGNRVFTSEKNAVLFMTNSMKTNNNELLSILEGYVDRLIAADHALADIALHQAMSAGGSDNFISHAKDELIMGDIAANSGKATVAINHYRNTWQHSQKAINISKKTRR